MAVLLETSIMKWVGLSTDVKPTAATTTVPVGSMFYEYNTKLWYKTYDGTNWTVQELYYGLVFGGTCDAGMAASTTEVFCADLAGYGNDYFNGKFYMHIIKNKNSIGNAPDNELRQVADYVSATGGFVVAAFSANVEEKDEVFIIHQYAVPHTQKYLTIAALDQDPPVQNTWYTVLDTTLDVTIRFLAFRQIHDEAGAKALEMKVTIDGVTLTGTQAANDSTWYYLYLDPVQNALVADATLRNAAYNVALPGQSVKVEVRTTAALGTNPKLDGRVQYSRLVVT